MRIHTGTLILAITPLLVGCTQKWGDLPSYQYSGMVINKISKEPIYGADIEIRRSSLKFSWWPMVKDETLATTTTGSDGSFSAYTKSGYAQWIYAKAGEKYSALLDLPPEDVYNLMIEVRPTITTIDSRIYDRSQADKQYELRECVVDIINFHERYGGNYLSMDEYLSRSVIGRSQYQFVKENLGLFSFPAEPGFSRVFVSWGDELFILRSMSQPIDFVTVRNDFYYPKKVEQDGVSNSDSAPVVPPSASSE